MTGEYIEDIYIHPTAYIENNVILGKGVKIWHFCHIRENAVIGDRVSLGKDVYIDKGVTVGKYSRVQNGVSVYAGVSIGEWCFIGPHVVFTNDIYPRAGLRKWKIIETKLETGISIGAGAIIRCGVTIGSFAMVGAGALVTHSIAPFHLYLGIPAKYERIICACGLTRFRKVSNPKELLRDCCEERLDPELYKVSANYIENNFDLLHNYINLSKRV